MARRVSWCALPLFALVLCALPLRVRAGPRYSSRIVHTDTGAIRGIIVEPSSRRLEPVEVFLGVPYAAPPQRLAPPAPAPRWPGTRLADAVPPACPHAPPDIANKTAALSKMPLGVYNELKQSVPLIANQSEDCLYLNIYVPGSGSRGVEAPYAVVVAPGARDGAVLAARAHLLVITLSYRIGLLGFLTSGSPPDPVHVAGGAGVLDVLAALRWARRNVPAFGGDATRVTLLAHGEAAALANTLLMMPDAKGLVSRVMLLSGSALSPASLAPDPALARRHAADALRCAPDAPTPNGEHWLVSCVRSRPLAALLAVEAPRARFLAGWAPSVPLSRAGAPQSPSRALHASDAFLHCALAVVLTTTESYRYFSEDEIRHGFEEEHRNRILRTYVRNVYRYHRNEIFAAARNEYTDWEKPIQHPINIRDATLEALSDAAAAAPAMKLAQLHARRGAATYLAHLLHQGKDIDYPQRLGSVPSESLPYFLGLPLVGGLPLAPRNYSRADVAVAETCVALLAAFAKTGEPSPPPREDHHGDGSVTWPRYELNTQQYLSIGTKIRVKSHYRGHKMALWLHLVPQLHRPGAAPRHHQFRAQQPDMFAGEIFPELYTTAAEEPDSDSDGEGESADNESVAEEEGGDGAGDECSPPPALPALPAPRPSMRPGTLATVDDQYYSYTVALGVTVGAGCFLLALNVLVFAGIYLQRGRRRHRHRARAAGSFHREGSNSSRLATSSLGSEPAAITAATAAATASPRKSTLKRSSESELKERPSCTAPPAKKRVQIQEISV